MSKDITKKLKVRILEFLIANLDKTSPNYNEVLKKVYIIYQIFNTLLFWGSVLVMGFVSVNTGKGLADLFMGG